jgi:hypothetical protein
VFAAGGAGGPKDIVDSVAEASAAATKVAIHLGAPPAPPAPPDDGLQVEISDILAPLAVGAGRIADVQRG